LICKDLCTFLSASNYAETSFIVSLLLPLSLKHLNARFAIARMSVFASLITGEDCYIAGAYVNHGVFSSFMIPILQLHIFNLLPHPHRDFCSHELMNNPNNLSIDFNASLKDDYAYTLLNFDFLPPQSRPKILGSCRGFLFLVHTCFYLCHSKKRFLHLFSKNKMLSFF
jgi:hypothetical protein